MCKKLHQKNIKKSFKKSIKKSRKIDKKLHQKSRFNAYLLFISLGTHFGSNLGALGDPLGALGPPKWVKKGLHSLTPACFFLMHFQKCTKLVKISIWDPLGVQFGAIWDHLGTPWDLCWDPVWALGEAFVENFAISSSSQPAVAITQHKTADNRQPTSNYRHNPARRNARSD